MSKGSKGNDATLYAVSKLRCMSTPVHDESEVDTCCHFVAHTVALQHVFGPIKLNLAE